MEMKENLHFTKENWIDLADDAYHLGWRYEEKYHGCGQCTIAAVLDTLNLHSDDVFRSATGLAGGLGLVGEATCSAFTGAVMVFGLIYPRRREKFDNDRENKYRTFEMAQELYRRYTSRFDSIICHDVHKKILGRPYDLRDPNERDCFAKAGAHENKCTEVVASASKWAVEIIGVEMIKEQNGK